ncbi:hypothetical protein BSL78_22343 [Apostichopus japonicus]|uniref:Uncharacterized protein n=1 Tax=Stichopus japonicus TaxID=307972 RepID=A0A2G8JYN4_STIJA|nr:hypothetical protein BSL78_22343 [Apostichopus japonicus]
MVARPKQLEFRGTLCDTATNDIDNDGRVTVRMGSSLEQSHSMGDVVPNRNISPHQHPGDDGGQKSPGSFNDHVQGTITTIFTDNTTVVAYINRQGGTRSERLCRLAWEVITAAEDSGTILRASHIAGKLNVMADALSRGHIDPNEWSLEQETCDRIFSIFGRPTIDLFATHKNNKLQTFCSRRFHPLAYHTDAMSLSWDHMDAYIFPPLMYDRTSPQENSELQGQVHTNSPVLASQTLVRRDPPTPHGRPSESTGQAPPTVPETGNSLPPRHQGVTISCLEAVRSSLRQRGFSEAAAAMAADARRGTTAATYDSRLRKFDQWCRPRQILLPAASVTQIAEFLLSLWRRETSLHYQELQVGHRCHPPGLPRWLHTEQ